MKSSISSLLLILVIATSLYSQEIYKVPVLKTVLDVKKNYPVYKIIASDEGLSNKFLDDMVKSALRDKYWKDANKEYFKNTKNKKGQSVPFGDLEKTLELLRLSSVKNNNPLSAYFGVFIVAQWYLNTGENAKEYLNDFTTVLIKNNFCSGVIYKYDSYVKGFVNKKKDYESGNGLLKTHEAICKNPKVAYSLRRAYLGRVAVSDYILKRRAEKRKK